MGTFTANNFAKASYPPDKRLIAIPWQRHRKKRIKIPQLIVKFKLFLSALHKF